MERHSKSSLAELISTTKVSVACERECCAEAYALLQAGESAHFGQYEGCGIYVNHHMLFGASSADK